MIVSIGKKLIEPWRGDSGGCVSQSTPTQMSDTQQHKDPRKTYPTNSASEDDSSSEYQPDDEPTLLNPKAANEENQPP